MDQWYGAQLRFRSEGGGSDSLIESSIRLIRAPDDATARVRAEAVGREAEHSYLNEDGETVSWRFEGVVALHSIDEDVLEHGVEVFSRLDWAD